VRNTDWGPSGSGRGRTIFSYSSEATASLKVPIYEKMIDHFLAQRLGKVTRGVLDLVPQDVPSLVIGTWPEDSPAPSGKTLRFDHSRPVSPDNQHLLGMVTLLDDGALDLSANVDFWRFLLPYDLNRMLEESLRVSRQLILVQSHGAGGSEGLMSSCSTLECVADMLAHRRSVTISKIADADVLRISYRHSLRRCWLPVLARGDGPDRWGWKHQTPGSAQAHERTRR
jgi:hypothetical protein